jgi:hypothetical protein
LTGVFWTVGGTLVLQSTWRKVTPVEYWPGVIFLRRKMTPRSLFYGVIFLQPTRRKITTRPEKVTFLRRILTGGQIST